MRKEGLTGRRKSQKKICYGSHHWDRKSGDSRLWLSKLSTEVCTKKSIYSVHYSLDAHRSVKSPTPLAGTPVLLPAIREVLGHTVRLRWMEIRLTGCKQGQQRHLIFFLSCLRKPPPPTPHPPHSNLGKGCLAISVTAIFLAPGIVSGIFKFSKKSVTWINEWWKNALPISPFLSYLFHFPHCILFLPLNLSELKAAFFLKKVFP